MRGRKLISGVYWQEELKQKGVKQGLRVFFFLPRRSGFCFRRILLGFMVTKNDTSACYSYLFIYQQRCNLEYKTLSVSLNETLLTRNVNLNIIFLCMTVPS